MKKITLLLIFTFFAILFSCETSTFQDIEQDPAATTQNNSGSTDNTSGSTSGSTTGSTSGTTTTTSNVTYTTDVKPIITNNCIACHFSGGESPALGTYTQVKNATSAGKLLCTIQAQGCRTMPPSGKMSQANINLILLWKTQGYIQ